MKLILINSIRLALLVAVFAATPAYAQDARLQISQLDRLSDRAVDSIDVTVDEGLMQLAAKFLKDSSKDQALAKELISGLKGVYVKRFEFDSDNAYTEADIEPIRAQLRGPGWARIVNVRSKRKGNFDVLLMSEGNVIRGLAVVAAEPRALTIVNVVGPIDLDKLRQLEGKFGIPRFGLEHGDASEKTETQTKRPEDKPPSEVDEDTAHNINIVIDGKSVDKKVRRKN